jgi:hypothetical protein
VATGLRFDMKSNRMRGVVPVDAQNKATSHITTFHIDGIIDFNAKKIKL